MTADNYKLHTINVDGDIPMKRYPQIDHSLVTINEKYKKIFLFVVLLMNAYLRRDHKVFVKEIIPEFANNIIKNHYDLLNDILDDTSVLERIRDKIVDEIQNSTSSIGSGSIQSEINSNTNFTSKFTEIINQISGSSSSSSSSFFFSKMIPIEYLQYVSDAFKTDTKNKIIADLDAAFQIFIRSVQDEMESIAFDSKIEAERISGKFRRQQEANEAKRNAQRFKAKLATEKKEYKKKYYQNMIDLQDKIDRHDMNRNEIWLKGLGHVNFIDGILRKKWKIQAKIYETRMNFGRHLDHLDRVQSYLKRRHPYQAKIFWNLKIVSATSLLTLKFLGFVSKNIGSIFKVFKTGLSIVKGAAGLAMKGVKFVASSILKIGSLAAKGVVGIVKGVVGIAAIPFAVFKRVKNFMTSPMLKRILEFFTSDEGAIVLGILKAAWDVIVIGKLKEYYKNAKNTIELFKDTMFVPENDDMSRFIKALKNGRPESGNLKNEFESERSKLKPDLDGKISISKYLRRQKLSGMIIMLGIRNSIEDFFEKVGGKEILASSVSTLGDVRDTIEARFKGIGGDTTDRYSDNIRNLLNGEWFGRINDIFDMFTDNAIATVKTTLVSTGLTTLGFRLGAFIPIPILGPFIGGLIGFGLGELYSSWVEQAQINENAVKNAYRFRKKSAVSGRQRGIDMRGRAEAELSRKRRELKNVKERKNQLSEKRKNRTITKEEETELQKYDQLDQDIKGLETQISGYKSQGIISPDDVKNLQELKRLAQLDRKNFEPGNWVTWNILDPDSGMLDDGIKSRIKERLKDKELSGYKGYKANKFPQNRDVFAFAGISNRNRFANAIVSMIENYENGLGYYTFDNIKEKYNELAKTILDIDNDRKNTPLTYKNGNYVKFRSSALDQAYEKLGGESLPMLPKESDRQVDRLSGLRSSGDYDDVFTDWAFVIKNKSEYGFSNFLYDGKSHGRYEDIKYANFGILQKNQFDNLLEFGRKNSCLYLDEDSSGVYKKSFILRIYTEYGIRYLRISSKESTYNGHLYYCITGIFKESDIPKNELKKIQLALDESKEKKIKTIFDEKINSGYFSGIFTERQRDQIWKNLSRGRNLTEEFFKIPDDKLFQIFTNCLDIDGLSNLKNTSFTDSFKNHYIDLSKANNIGIIREEIRDNLQRIFEEQKKVPQTEDQKQEQRDQTESLLPLFKKSLNDKFEVKTLEPIPLREETPMSESQKQRDSEKSKKKLEKSMSGWDVQQMNPFVPTYDWFTNPEIQSIDYSEIKIITPKNGK